MLKKISGDIMKRNWKYKLARLTGYNYKLNKKIMRLKHSWDEVEAILNQTSKKSKKKKK